MRLARAGCTRRRRRSEPLLSGLDPPAPPQPASEVIERLGLWERPARAAARPRVLLNMVAPPTAARRSTGARARSASDADRELFHALRAVVRRACWSAPARCARALRAPCFATRRLRELRASAGSTEEPLACIVSGRLVARSATSRCCASRRRAWSILTASAASVPRARRRRSSTCAAPRTASSTCRPRSAELAERFAIASLLCEGGPHLARAAARRRPGRRAVPRRLAPKLAGGEPSGGEALRILAGAELDPPAALELLGALRERLAPVPALRGPR